MPCSYCGFGGHNNRTCQEKKKYENVLHPIHDLPIPDPQNLQPLSNNSGLRAVLPSADIIWNYRANEDAYSRHNKNSIETLFPERDHVFEIQLLDLAFDLFSRDSNVQMITRSDRSVAQKLANCVENTNVTTRAINRSKKGPFTRAKNDYQDFDYQSNKCPGIDSYVFTKGGSRRCGKYPGFSTANWAHIKTEVVASYEHINDKIPEVLTERKAALFQDYLTELFLSLQIDEA